MSPELFTQDNRTLDSNRELLAFSGFEANPKVQKIIKTEVSQAITNGTCIWMPHSNDHFGDHLIIRSAVSRILTKFTNEQGLPPAVLSMQKQQPERCVDIRKLVARWGFDLMAYEATLNGLTESYSFWLADHLGVQVTTDELTYPPLPLTCDFEKTPMQNFSLEKTLGKVEEIRRTIDPDKSYCVILHGGSVPAKRFGHDQVRDIKNTLKTLFPRNGYIILTADDIDGNGGPPFNSNDADLVINATKDINLTAALFLAPRNITFVTSDTFLFWLGGGMIALRGDRNGTLQLQDVYVLNTLSSSLFWRMPGANHCESFAVEHLREKHFRMESSADNLIYPAEYYKEYKSFKGVKDLSNAHIASEDIAKFTRAIAQHNLLNSVS